MRSEYDIIVLGGGAAGFSAVVAAAEAGANVLLISEGPLGGTCVNFGCVPSKYLLTRLAVARKAGGRIRLPDLLREASIISSELRADKYESLLDSLGVDYIKGKGRFKGKGIIEVNGREVRYRRASIIAVGAKAWKPPIDGLDAVSSRIIDNERLFSEPIDLGSIIIIGGRAQGVEIAQIMARSGVETTLLQRSPRLLPDDEPEAGYYMKEILVEDGVKLETGVRIRGVKESSVGVSVLYEVNGSGRIARGEYIYLATGRKPQLEGLGLENVGVKVSPNGYIVVDEHLRASEGIYAAGDCINGYMLEPVAAKEGYVAAMNALGDSIKMDYTVIPRAVFTDPEFASVGLTERELARRLGVCSCRTVDIRDVPKARILGYTKGFFKIVVDPRNKRIVGTHMMAPNAADAIHEIAVAMKAGMTIDDIIDLIHVFPTISEGLKYAALAFYRDVSKMPCCLV
ncbi:MAG: mercury(II) reductase [Desulfurococcales archaeon]|nr:mercury(II) reductase [Desulfurococcales archaeon]